MKKYQSFAFCLAGGASLCALPVYTYAQAKKHPHIILIMTD